MEKEKETNDPKEVQINVETAEDDGRKLPEWMLKSEPQSDEIEQNEDTNSHPTSSPTKDNSEDTTEIIPSTRVIYFNSAANSVNNLLNLKLLNRPPHIYIVLCRPIMA